MPDDTIRADRARGRLLAADLSVKDLMSTKLDTILPNCTLQDAADLMHRKGIRHLPVVDKANKLCGLITHRDILRFTISEAKHPTKGEKEAALTDIHVCEAMQDDRLSKVRTFSADENLRTAAIRIRENKIGCLLIVDANEQLVGIITESDFVKFFADAI